MKSKQRKQHKGKKQRKISRQIQQKEEEGNQNTDKIGVQEKLSAQEDNENNETKQKQEQVEGEQNINNLNEGDSDEQQSSKWKVVPKPEKSLKLHMIDFNQCDSKKCTGRKMERFGLLKSIKDKKKKFKGVVLSAFGEQPISMEDLDICVKHGICVIDCSWNRIDQTNQYRFKHQRVLPYVVAGNPVNYGKPYQLSCAQALATALCSIGYQEQSEYIMSKFGWADGFWSINTHISEYAQCKTMEQLRQMSEEIKEGPGAMKQREYQMPESSESDQEQK